MSDVSSTVWMVNVLTGPLGAKGTLLLEASRLVFRPDSTDGETFMSFAGIRRVRRVRGSPVMEVYLTDSTDRPSTMGFYFVQPPSLEPKEGRRYRRERAARRSAVAVLLATNREKKDEIKRWVVALEKAIRSGAEAGEEGP